MLNHRLKKIINHLICPTCHGHLDIISSGLSCNVCKKIYPEKNGRLYFLDVPANSTDPMDIIKERLKRFLGKWYYRIGVDLLSPNFPFNYGSTVTSIVNPSDKLVVDIGSGNNRISPEVICVDMFDYKEVDLVCDVLRLPFASESVDACVTRSMIEHIPNPPAVVEEFHRVTMQGGYGIHLIPFLMPFHASPYDYQRYTNKGAELLFGRWKLVEQRSPFGPFSLMVNILVELGSILTSFGLEKLRAPSYFFWCLILFPIKFFDYPFRTKTFFSLSPSILTIVVKQSEDK